MAWTQVVATGFQEQFRRLGYWLNVSDEGQGGVTNDSQALTWITRWLVVLFTMMGAQKAEGAENNELSYWEAVFDLSWPCAMAHGGF